MAKARQKIEFGDFQTPIALARNACKVVAALGFRPASVVEPTCGMGSFLSAAANTFPNVERMLGVEINEQYVEIARRAAVEATIVRDNFFGIDWKTVFADLVQPILVIGNPPWVTNAVLTSLGSSNLPHKSNFQRRTGFDAITGKSNFDISEWMLMKLMEWLAGRDAMLAILCKTTVARKCLAHAWKRGLRIKSADIYSIDSQRHFGASVESCLFVCHLHPRGQSHECRVYATLESKSPLRVIGYCDEMLVSDAELYCRWRHLCGKSVYTWRSGIKHDSARIMELERTKRGYKNKLGEVVDIEDTCLYPMLKSSDVAGAKMPRQRWMLVTQKSTGEETGHLKEAAPKTWDYLKTHSRYLDGRGSAIYRNRPRFSVFGVGEYAFAPWKVVISGFYKRLDFRAIGPIEGKPTVFDDTVYFIPCQKETEAAYVAALLNSGPARELLSSLVFWDAKRPITVDVLRRLDLRLLAAELGSCDEFDGYRRGAAGQDLLFAI